MSTTVPKRQLKICKASAGAGKTYTLVLEYLTIALSQEDGKKYKRILAVTFTNMAANEMKERIIKELKDLAFGTFENDNYLHQLQSRLGLEEKEVTKRAKRTLAGVLHDYSDFSVMTIDKFVHKITRSFSRELDISPDFDIEMDDKEVKERISDTLLEQAGQDEEITRLLKQALLLRIDLNKNWNLKNDLTEFAGLLMKEDLSQKIEQLPEYSVDELLKYKEELQAEIKKYENFRMLMVEDFENTIQKAGFEFDDFASNLKKVLISLKDNSIDDTKINKLSTVKYWTEEAMEGVFFTPSKFEKIKTQIAPHLEEWTQKFHALNDYITGDPYKVYLEQKTVLKNLFLTGVLSKLKKVADEIKRDDNFLMISDFYKLITDLILKEPVAYIYEKMGNRYDHFLIDEFQDTSVLQWLNFIPLMENSLAQGNANFIVGDLKQSIYRFRNGEVEQFKALPHLYNPSGNEFISEKELSFINNEQPVILDVNRRSCPTIVDFNNNFFEHLVNTEQYKPLAAYYENLRQEKHKETPIGKVKWFDITKSDKEQAIEIEMELIMDQIHEKIEEGYRYKDMTILSRANKDGTRIANTLVQKGIPVISQESLEIKSHPTTKAVLYYLELLLNPEKRQLLGLFLENYFRVHPEKKERVSYDEMVFNKQDQNKEKTTKVLHKLNLTSSFQEFNNYSLFRLIERLIKELDFEVDSNVYLQFLLHLTFDFMGKKNGNPDLFIEWFWEKGGEKSVKIPDSIDAVSVTSIHKSKGLQYKIVLVPQTKIKNNAMVMRDVKESGNERVPQVLTEVKKHGIYEDEYEAEGLKNKLDLVNIYYVAFTRAEHQLIVFNVDNSLQKVVEQMGGETREEKGIESLSWGVSGQFNPKENELQVRLKASKLAPFRDEEIPKFAHFTPVSEEQQDWKLRMEEGRLVHEVLSKITHLPIKEDEVNNFFHKNKVKHSDALMIELKSFIDDIQLQPFYDPKAIIWTERGLITSEGKRKVPDRVVETDRSILVLDFKTGMPKNAHIKQVEDYVNLLRSIETKPVQGYLYYTGNKKLITV